MDTCNLSYGRNPSVGTVEVRTGLSMNPGQASAAGRSARDTGSNDCLFLRLVQVWQISRINLELEQRFLC
jgi:hypothetical protein